MEKNNEQENQIYNSRTYIDGFNPDNHKFSTKYTATKGNTKALTCDEGNFLPGNYSRLTPERESDINLSLEPGLYVLEINARWKEKGSVIYGFLLKIQ